MSFRVVIPVVLLGVCSVLVHSMSVPAASAQDAATAPVTAPATDASGAPDGAAAVPAGSGFAARLAAGMEGGAVAWDRLFAPSARSDARRMLDARAHALFDWSNVSVVSEGEMPLGADLMAEDFVLSGTATWLPNAWGVAVAFWTPQWDERFESNDVVRRERWIRKRGSGDRIAREPLASLAVVEAKIDVGAYPGQSAILVDATYYVRALADGVRNIRFLLDRRSHIYDLRVNGKLVGLVRGNELGSLGLEGFSPQLESSFVLPRALDKGEEALVKFRLRSPIVHMQGDGYVTSLPLMDGTFRERAWIPLLGPAGGSGEANLTDVELSVRWPHGEYETVGVAARTLDEFMDAPAEARLEERRILLTSRADLRDLDFVLLAEGASFEDLPHRPVRVGAERRPGVFWFERLSGGADTRTRAALVDPLLDAAQSSSRDLSSELEDLVPLDADVMDELFDASSDDGERGSDDRSAE